jgi:hypothetical protein
MAGYERNPKLHRRMAALLAIGETLALTVVSWPIFLQYFSYAVARLGQPAGFLRIILSATFTLACLVGALFVSRRFIRGAPGARWALVVANVVIIAMGVAWYVHASLSERPEKWVGLCGLMLPMVTLFPLLWPLLVFKPRSESPAGDSAAPVPEARPPAVRLPPSTRPPEP